VHELAGYLHRVRFLLLVEGAAGRALAVKPFIIRRCLSLSAGSWPSAAF
jgi:hypothetical protein